VGLSECLEVGTVEVVGGDVDLENGFQLALGFVLPALMDGEGRDDVRGCAAQCGGGLGRVVDSGVVGRYGPVGPVQEVSGPGLVMGECTHAGWLLLLDERSLMEVVGCYIDKQGSIDEQDLQGLDDDVGGGDAPWDAVRWTLALGVLVYWVWGFGGSGCRRYGRRACGAILSPRVPRADRLG
jgi:hypothetical protein